MKNLDFSPLVRLAELSWDDVEFMLNDYLENNANPVRPLLSDYSNLHVKLGELLKSVPFSPPLFRLDRQKEQLTVHLGAASIIAATLDLEFSDTCIDVLYHRAISDSRARGSRMTDEWNISMLRDRTDEMSRILDQFYVVREEETHLDVRGQYMNYAFNDEDPMTYEEFQDSISESCFNTIQNVLIVELQLVKNQLDAACSREFSI